MGFFGLGKKRSEVIVNTRKLSPVETENWIEVYFTYDEDVNGTTNEKRIREHLAEECMNLLEIFMNQKEIVTLDNRHRTHVNPKINGEGTLTITGSFPGSYPAKTKNLKRNFFPEFKKIKGSTWKITIKGDNKYSPNELVEDMNSLVNLNNELTKYLNIDTNLDGQVLPSIEIDKNKNPLYIETRSMLVISCKVKDRIKLSGVNKELDTELFNGQGIFEFINETKEMKSKSKKDLEWIEKVDNLKSKNKK
jgi:hypothetical protein